MIKGLKVGFVLFCAILWIVACSNTPTSRRDVPVVNGVVHTVQEGDTINAIAKTYEISSQLLIRRNNLHEGDVLRPGTRLFIPGAKEIRVVKIKETDSIIREERDGLLPKIGPGETLSAIAKAYKVPLNELQRVNNLPDPSKIYVNQEVWIPRAKEVKDIDIPKVEIATNSPSKPPYNDPRVVEKIVPTPSPTRKSMIKSASDAIASSASPNTQTAPTPTPVEFPRKIKEYGPVKFQWPLKTVFKVVRGYSPSPGQNFNPGIDLGTDLGAEVCASADGEVLMAGNVTDSLGTTGLGNYIILYHGDHNNKELYSVYAHNSQHLVKVGDKVKRGQVIAKVGNSGRTSVAVGGVLHFEIREQTEHINPSTVLPPLN